MNVTNISRQLRGAIWRGTAMTLTASMLLGTAEVALAASSTNPTLLVNTESFSTLDEGDGTTDLELRFGSSLNEKLYWNRTQARFEFTDDLQLQGNLAASGSIRAETTVAAKGNISINDDQTAADATLTFGQPSTNETITFSNSAGRFDFSDDVNVRGTMSGDVLYVTGNADVRGALAVSGAVRTDSNLTINDDQTAADATLTFGQPTTNETVTFSNSAGRFEFSDDVKVAGSISGSTLTVDGAVTLRGQTMLFPTNAGSNGNFLRTDGAGNLSWANSAVGNSSGGVVALSPEYAGATYFGSGSTMIGTLTNAYDTSNKVNYYRWASTRSTLQDYWIAVRVRVPQNFHHWDSTAPIQFQYRTGSGGALSNYLTVRMLDTAGTAVTLTNGANLVNTSLTTASITGPESAGTFTAGSYFTVLIKMAAKSNGSADAGFLNFRWSTTTP